MDKKTITTFNQSTNMTLSELYAWSRNPCSRKASLSREPLARIIRLKAKPVSEWNYYDFKNAKKVISFVARMKKVPAGAPVCGNLSKRTIALKNWGFDPNK